MVQRRRLVHHGLIVDHTEIHNQAAAEPSPTPTGLSERRNVGVVGVAGDAIVVADADVERSNDAAVIG